MNSPHIWNFTRFGGLHQVVISTADDLRNLKNLDPKLWVALACPVAGLEIDKETLALLDLDKDQRIRIPEILEAIQWASLRLKDLEFLLASSDTLPLDALNPDTPEGQRTLASARTILAGLGKADAQGVTLADAVARVDLFAATTLNGDGVITEATAEDDAEVKQIIQEILATVGGTLDRSGNQGVDQSRTDAFYDACVACVGWLTQGRSPEINTLGEDTPAAAAAVNAIQAKVDDYFARTRLAAFDARALHALNRSESEYLELFAKDLSITAQEIEEFPLARVEAGKPLPLLEAVNPAWADALAALHRLVVQPIFGQETDQLNEEQWSQLKARFAPYNTWIAAKGGAVVEVLGPERIEEILASDTRKRVNALIEADKALEPEFNSIHGVERLIRYGRDFRTLLDNFINFLDFYAPERRAIFQAGTLFLDSRSTELCIQVDGASPLAAMSKVYIAYCDCTRHDQPPMKIAACFTQGDSDYLFVGRNGLFYDRKGRDWDAKITAVVDSPISVRQAFFLPYKKLVRMIEEHAARRAADAEAKSEARMSAAADAGTDVTTYTAAETAAPKKVDVGTVAAIGVAISGGITALTLILGYVFGLKLWQYPLVLVGLVAVISGPSMLIAWLKLRQRTLGPILEANGWAINGRVKISVPFGTRLTCRAKLPPGSRYTQVHLNEEESARGRRIFLWAVLMITVLAALVRWDASRHDGTYFWQESEPAPIVEEP